MNSRACVYAGKDKRKPWNVPIDLYELMNYPCEETPSDTCTFQTKISYEKLNQCNSSHRGLREQDSLQNKLANTKSELRSILDSEPSLLSSQIDFHGSARKGCVSLRSNGHCWPTVALFTNRRRWLQFCVSLSNSTMLMSTMSFTLSEILVCGLPHPLLPGIVPESRSFVRIRAKYNHI